MPDRNLSGKSTRTRAEVAIPLPLDQTFTYSVPEQFRQALRVGERVWVPFGRRKVTGFVVGFPQRAERRDLRPLIDRIDDGPLIEPPLLDLIRWVSQYYIYPLGAAIKSALPAGLFATTVRKARLGPRGREALERGGEKGGRLRILLALKAARGPLVITTLAKRLGLANPHSLFASLEAAELVEIIDDSGRRAGSRKRTGILDDDEEPRGRSSPPDLMPEQARALEEIESARREGGFRPFLLHGITGSGKTEVYLRAIEAVGAEGRGAIVLVPEISLTPQLVRRFRERFEEPVAVQHSGLTPSERLAQWHRIRTGEVRIVIGARSAVFAPLKKLGIVIVDEEHDGSYKQEEGLRYSARDVAVVRAKREGACVLLGSATPSLESYYNARAGRYRLLELPKRVARRSLPEIDVVDMRERSGRGLHRIFSKVLLEGIERTVAEGSQVILFLNRRGFSPSVHCWECGYLFRCENCSIGLTYHNRREVLLCHYCSYEVKRAERCPQCSGKNLGLVGTGTERLEEELSAALPSVRIARLDRDTTRRRGSHREILDRFRRREVDVLIGTQMITKGHDYPGVTLVGILMAEQSLNFPDFRAAERTYQLLTQVSGRAGRGDRPGRVIVQSLHPDHPSIAGAVRGAFEPYYNEEIAFRSELGYPPFARLILLLITSDSSRKARAAAERIGDMLRREISKKEAPGKTPGTRDCALLGPAQAPIGRLRGRYRWQILLKSRDHNTIRRLAACVVRVASERRLPSDVAVSIDVDPLNML